MATKILIKKAAPVAAKKVVRKAAPVAAKKVVKKAAPVARKAAPVAVKEVPAVKLSKTEIIIRDRSDKGLSLRALLNSTPPYVKMKARDEVVIKKYTPGARTKGGHPAVTAVCISMTHRAPVRHKLSIIGLDKDVSTLGRQKRVLVSCDCEDFMYTWEYALSTWGAARIQFSNGDPAVVKNPGNYPGMCIAGGELVYTDRGIIPVEGIRIGDKVSTLSGYRTVLDSGCTGRRKTVTVKTSSGRSLTLTPDHRVFAVDEHGVPKWIQAGKLNPSYHLIGVNRAEFGGSATITEQECTVLGYLVSELYKGRFYNERESIRQSFREAVLSIDKNGIAFEGEGSIILSDNMQKHMSRYFWNEDSAVKEIPGIILAQPEVNVLAFLRALWDGDGCFTEKTCTYGSKSSKLVKQLQILLGAFGVASRITKNLVRPGTEKEITMWLLRITDSASKRILLGHLIKYELPNETNPDPEDLSVYGTAAYRETFPVNVRNIVLAELTKKVIEEETRSNDVVKTRDWMDSTGVSMDRDTLNRELRVLGYRRDKKSAAGKPHAAARVKDIEEVTRAYRLRARYRAVCLNNTCLTGPLGPTSTRTKEGAIKTLETLDVSGKTRRRVSALLQDDVWFDRVISVKKSRKAVLVYDLTVEGTPHFTANSFVVHNCKHLTAVAKLVKEQGD